MSEGVLKYVLILLEEGEGKCFVNVEGGRCFFNGGSDDSADEWVEVVCIVCIGEVGVYVVLLLLFLRLLSSSSISAGGGSVWNGWRAGSISCPTLYSTERSV